jgi:hypothetical protein
MKYWSTLCFCLCCFAGASRAAQVNLATMTCVRYQNEVIAPPVATPGADAINTMMWLFGYAVGNSGAHVMYGDALAGFGFALDAECKNNPTESLLDALAKIKPDNKNPMDLTGLECQTFASRHLELVKSDHESAETIMMWLFGLTRAVWETLNPRSWPTAKKIPAAVFSTRLPPLNSDLAVRAA